ncbi:glutamate-cysteine ligase family protein [Streptomyces erythrochromogenes]
MAAVLMAISANSPFWQGEDSGHAITLDL